MTKQHIPTYGWYIIGGFILILILTIGGLKLQSYINQRERQLKLERIEREKREERVAHLKEQQDGIQYELSQQSNVESRNEVNKEKELEDMIYNVNYTQELQEGQANILRFINNNSGKYMELAGVVYNISASSKKADMRVRFKDSDSFLGYDSIHVEIELSNPDDILYLSEDSGCLIGGYVEKLEFMIVDGFRLTQSKIIKY